jgi:hypothetical protein
LYKPSKAASALVAPYLLKAITTKSYIYSYNIFYSQIVWPMLISFPPITTTTTKLLIPNKMGYARNLNPIQKHLISCSPI